MRTVYFVTTNNYKFKKLSDVFSVPEVELLQLYEETPEIQAKKNQEVAAFSAKWAANKFNLPVIKEDVGLYIEALKGFPGPYLNQIEKWIETDGFLKLMENVSNRYAFWEYTVAYCEPGKDPVTYSTFHKGNIAKEAKGKGGWIADKVFIPLGQTNTISELLDENKYVRNIDHYQKLSEYIKSLNFKD